MVLYRSESRVDLGKRDHTTFADHVTWHMILQAAEAYVFTESEPYKQGS
jgi:hypothetical protein